MLCILDETSLVTLQLTLFRFNFAHRKLYNRLRQLGAEEFFERGEADEQHPDGMDGTWVPWMTGLHGALHEQYPLAPGEEPIPDDVYLPPEWTLDFVPDQVAVSDISSIDAAAGIPAEAANNGTDSSSLSPGNNSTTPAVALADHGQIVVSETTHSGPTHSSSNESITSFGHFTARLSNTQRVTPDDHWQDVRLFEFTTPPVAYEPGDVLTIFPHNSPTAVEKLITLMHWEEFADESIHFVPGSPNIIPANPEPIVPHSTGQSELTLRKLVSRHLDLNAIPRRSFFSSLAHFTTDESQHERLTEFSKAEYIDEFFDYATRPRRSIIEVLDEFDTVKLPWRWIADILPAVRGRQFSIASGGDLQRNADGSGKIELLIAMVKYRTIIKKTREGLCSRYLSGLGAGDRLEVLLCKGGMRVDLDKPALLIGPGTGVAPLRSMLLERAQLEAKHGATEKQKQLLFFGGRNRSADYFFEQDWQKLKSQIDLEVYTAFSRDQVRCFQAYTTSFGIHRLTTYSPSQSTKVYVQTLIRKHARSVLKILQRGNVYICGYVRFKICLYSRRIIN